MNESPPGIVQDSTKKTPLLDFLSSGYLKTKYFDFDLKYLIKYNQFEALRTGAGGVTNDNFSETYRIKGYTVYGFKDHRFKYSVAGGFRIAPKRNTWVYLSYTDDLEETGSSNFLTDKRLFQLFEPRLLNIDLFHKHISKAINIEHQIFNKVVAETEFALRSINPTYTYTYDLLNGNSLSEYNTTTLKISAQWSPFSTFEYINNSIKETKIGFPNFTFQYTRGFKDFINGDLSFSRLDFRAIQSFRHKNNDQTELIVVGGMANGDIPLQYLYHAYPNNVTKETILRRFTVAGINSFETMYFNEFFSDRFVTLQIKHRFDPFEISPWFKPQLVLISRMALGNMDNIERHQGISFNTLNKGFTESGIELNQLVYGFGLSFAYRYGAYHLPKFEDNISFKFTFNISLN
ncbi:MAG: hypothetical protein KJO77_09655 [Bacteroidia bacterium]|nr:hypothetical protein [Bacteroidia bacterium]